MGSPQLVQENHQPFFTLQGKQNGPCTVRPNVIFIFCTFQHLSKQEIFNVLVLLLSLNYFYLKQTSCCEVYFYFLCFKKGLALNKNKKSFKSVHWDLCNFFMTQVTQIILKNDKSIYIFGLSFLTLSVKDAKSKFTSVSSIFSLRVHKTEKTIPLPFFPFLILYKKRKKQFYFRFSVFSFLDKKRKQAILLPFFRFFVCEQKKHDKSNYCTNIHFRYFLFCGNGMRGTEVAVGGMGMG